MGTFLRTERGNNGKRGTLQWVGSTEMNEVHEGEKSPLPRQSVAIFVLKPLRWVLWDQGEKEKVSLLRRN